MAVPTKPVAGAVVESAWGQAVHDAVVAMRGVQVSWASLASNVATKATINAGGQGATGWVDIANKWIVVPIAGLYLCQYSIVSSGFTNGFYRNGFGFDANPVGSGSNAAWTGNSSAIRWSYSFLYNLAAGTKVWLEYSAPAFGTGTQTNAADLGGVYLIAHSLAAA